MNYLIIAMAVALALLAWDDHSVRGDNSKLLIEKGQIETALQTEKNNLTVCSNNTKELKKAQDTKEEQVRKGQEAAKVKAKPFEIRAQETLGAKPSTPTDMCKSADDLMKDYLDKRQK